MSRREDSAFDEAQYSAFFLRLNLFSIRDDTLWLPNFCYAHMFFLL